jgi:hypothetical protein
MTSRGLIGAVLAACLTLSGCSGSVPTFAPAATETPVVTLPPEIALSGKIEFGGDFDQSTLEIIRPAARFKTSSTAIAYVAHLREAAGATELTLSLTRRASGGAETSVFTRAFDVASPDYDTFANSFNFALLADRKAGTYVLRIIREGKVLAEGTFTLVK